MKARWAIITALLMTALAVPLATAGAEAPTSSGAPANEGSIPPGGTVNCQVAPSITPDHGPPGTEVTVAADFTGNCDDVNPVFLEGMECIGEVTGGGLEGFSFPVDVLDDGEGFISVSGTFTAPTEPDPPVVDAIEDLAVTITCTVDSGSCTSPSAAACVAAEGVGGTTTYVYVAVVLHLELFAAPDSDQPTIVDNDNDGVPDDVVSATPPFTG